MTKRSVAALLAAVSLSLLGPIAAGAQDAKTLLVKKAVDMGAELVEGTIKSAISSANRCTRHFYNSDSTYWFKVTGSPGSGVCERGCLLRPGKNIPVLWADGKDMMLDVEAITWSAAIPEPPQTQWKFKVVNGLFSKAAGDCVYITHSCSSRQPCGQVNIWSINPNDPANGDIKFISVGVPAPQQNLAGVRGR